MKVLRVSDELHGRLVEQARGERRTLRVVVESALEAYLGGSVKSGAVWEQPIVSALYQPKPRPPTLPVASGPTPAEVAAPVPGVSVGAAGLRGPVGSFDPDVEESYE